MRSGRKRNKNGGRRDRAQEMEFVDDWKEVGISFGSEREGRIYLGGIHCDRSS